MDGGVPRIFYIVGCKKCENEMTGTLELFIGDQNSRKKDISTNVLK
jgi:hypothetical protein